MFAVHTSPESLVPRLEIFPSRAGHLGRFFEEPLEDQIGEDVQRLGLDDQHADARLGAAVFG